MALASANNVQNTLIGYKAAATATALGKAVIIGYEAGAGANMNSADTNGMVAIGHSACKGMVDGVGNIGIG